ncbi:MAG: helix-turn-helix transcriptional regulator [Calditrichaeota bacterium]|nr:helix-turn-helix transcriptional regulator [Calditrichota bacterium]
MIFELTKPSPPLDQYVELLTYFANYSPDHEIERLLSDGSANIIFCLDQQDRYIFNNQSLEKDQKCTRVWLSGMHSNFLSISAGSLNSSMLVIRFHAGGSYPFIQMPIIDLNNLVVDAELVFGQEILDLYEQLCEDSDAQSKFRLVENWLMKRLQRCLLPETVIQYAVQHIKQSPSLESLKQISDQCGYSQKQFIHLFKKHIGLSPKAYQRIIRFNQVLQEIERHRHINWSQLVYDCGYYDQAHFIKEFKLFSGMNPSQFLAERGEYTNYIPIR